MRRAAPQQLESARAPRGKRRGDGCGHLCARHHGTGAPARTIGNARVLGRSTGCRNRASILAVLDTALTADNSGHTGTAVLLLDLDGFKAINDQSGHAIGDNVLRHTAQRLIASARASDFVGRLGGDEFLVVCPHVDGKLRAVQIANRILAALSEPIEIDGKRIAAMASVGVAWTNSDMNGGGCVGFAGH